MMKFEDLVTLIKLQLPAEWAGKNIWYEPGPDMPDQPVNYVVNLTTEPTGVGLSLEGVFDTISWQVKVASPQSIYAQGEQLAWDIDRALLNFPPGRVGGDGLLIGSIYRVGGGPSHFEIDDAERTQFVCSYFFDVESGLQYI